MELPNRRRNRLREFDYSAPGVYFLTFCTKDRECILWENVGARIARLEDIILSAYGEITEAGIHNIIPIYPAVSLDQYVIMPNHVHLLLRIESDAEGRPMVAPTVSTVVQQLKGYITKHIGRSIRQKSYYDHVIRNEEDYQNVWNYIEGNPLKWQEDMFFAK